MHDARLLLSLAASLLLVACPSGGNGFPPADDDDLTGVDDDDSVADDDDSVADDDDSVADDDDSVADDDDSVADDDDSVADDDDSVADDDDSVADDDDSIADDDDSVGDDDDSTPSGPGGPVMFLVGVACNNSVSASTVGFANNAWGYPACGLGDSGWDGSEYVVTLGQPGNISVTLSWSDTSVDLDLIILNGGDVTNSTCWGSSTATTGTSEYVTFSMPTGEQAWIIVDGKGTDAGDLSLVVSCS